MPDSAKPYELRFEERPGYLYVHVKAERINREIVMSYLQEIGAKCAELQCTRMVFSRDVPELLAAGDVFFVTGEFQKMIEGVRTAFVNMHAMNDEAFRFSVTVGTNRGADYNLFNNDSDAENWVLQG